MQLAAAVHGQGAVTANTGVVEGRVLGQDGEPMPGIEVWSAAWPKYGEVLARTRTDGDGMFVLPRQPLVFLAVFATADGCTVGMGNAPLTPEASRAGAQLRLWQAKTLRGRVVDEGGKAIAGASVLGTRDRTWFEGWFAPADVRTDAEGRFELKGVPIGDCVVRAWAPGCVMYENVQVLLSDAEVPVTLRRGDGVPLGIRAEGLPVDRQATTQVWLYATRGGTGFTMPGAIERGLLDGAGRLRLLGLPAVEWHCELSAAGYTFAPRSITTKVGEPVDQLVFRAVRNGSVQLRGRLRSDDGKALGAEHLVCRTRRSQSINGGEAGLALTDAGGRFRMDAPLVPAEPYSLHLVNSQWVLLQEKKAGTHQADHRYLVRYEDTADAARELDLVAVPAALLTARLLDADGQAVPFVWTELQVLRGGGSWSAMAYATSQRDGTVEFAGVHGIDADLRVHAVGSGGAGDSETFRLLRGGRRRLDVRMERPGVVAGTVFDASGRPMPAARVLLRNHDPETGRQTDGGWTSVPADRAGRYRFVGVPPGGHRVELDTMRKMNGTSEVFTVAPGATVVQDLRAEK